MDEFRDIFKFFSFAWVCSSTSCHKYKLSQAQAVTSTSCHKHKLSQAQAVTSTSGQQIVLKWKEEYISYSNNGNQKYCH